MSDIEDPINEYSVMINTVCVLDEPKDYKKPIDPKTLNVPLLHTLTKIVWPISIS